MNKLKIVYIKKSVLCLLEGNPRHVIDDNAKEKLKILIKEHGFQNPLQVYREKNGKYSILCGNHRFLAGCELGINEFPCIEYTGSREKALARAISDNKSNEWTEWDFPLLKDMIADIDTGEFDIGITGFDEKDLKKMFDFEKLEEQDIENKINTRILFECPKCGEKLTL